MKFIKLHANLAEGQRFTAHHAGRKTKLRAVCRTEGQEGVAEEMEEVSEGPCRGRVGVLPLSFPLSSYFPHVAARMALLSVIYPVAELETTSDSWIPLSVRGSERDSGHKVYPSVWRKLRKALPQA